MPAHPPRFARGLVVPPFGHTKQHGRSIIRGCAACTSFHLLIQSPGDYPRCPVPAHPPRFPRGLVVPPFGHTKQHGRSIIRGCAACTAFHLLIQSPGDYPAKRDFTGRAFSKQDVELTTIQQAEKQMDVRCAQRAVKMLGRAVARLRKWNWDKGEGQGAIVAKKWSDQAGRWKSYSRGMRPFQDRGAPSSNLRLARCLFVRLRLALRTVPRHRAVPLTYGKKFIGLGRGKDDGRANLCR